MTNHRHIPWLLVLIGSGFLLLMAWSIFLAGQRSSAVIDRDYYSHGLRYNETLLEQRAATALGWQVTTELMGRSLRFHLRDRQGRPVSEAQGVLYLSLPSNPSGLALLLHETTPGTYQVELAGSITGQISARLEFKRDRALLNRQLLLSL